MKDTYIKITCDSSFKKAWLKCVERSGESGSAIGRNALQQKMNQTKW